MCNKLHPESQPIPPTGRGWKVFRAKDGQLRPAFNVNTYKIGTNGWIHWKPNDDFLLSDKNYGFCFFLAWEEVQKLLDHNSQADTFALEIEYAKGLGRHIENNITVDRLGYETALCRSFRIVDRKGYRL